MSYRNTTRINSLSCVAQCNCNTSQYEPVCGADGCNYASPCNAGCTIRSLTNPDVSGFNNMIYNWPTKWYNVYFLFIVYIGDFMQSTVFLDCGCVMENTTQNMSALWGSSGDMSLVGSSVVPRFCNRIKLCSLTAIMLTIIGVYWRLNNYYWCTKQTEQLAEINILIVSIHTS